MSPDELRALAEALRKMRWHLMSIDDACDLEHAADYLLACADEQPVMQFVESQGAYTFEFLRSLTIKPGDLFYLHPAPAVPQPADRYRSSETLDPKATSAASPERPALNREDAAAQVAACSGEQREPLSDEQIAKGDFVLATKWGDGDPGDHWGVGFYDRLHNGRHYVLDNGGKQIRGNGFRRVGRITPEMGRWLLSAAAMLESSPPGTVNLWTMLTERAHGIGGSDDAK